MCKPSQVPLCLCSMALGMLLTIALPTWMTLWTLLILAVAAGLCYISGNLH